MATRLLPDCAVVLQAAAGKVAVVAAGPSLADTEVDNVAGTACTRKGWYSTEDTGLGNVEPAVVAVAGKHAQNCPGTLSPALLCYCHPHGRAPARPSSAGPSMGTRPAPWGVGPEC